MNVKFLAWCLADGREYKSMFPAPPKSIQKDETICPKHI